MQVNAAVVPFVPQKYTRLPNILLLTQTLHDLNLREHHISKSKALGTSSHAGVLGSNVVHPFRGPRPNFVYGLQNGNLHVNQTVTGRRMGNSQEDPISYNPYYLDHRVGPLVFEDSQASWFLLQPIRAPAYTRL